MKKIVLLLIICFLGLTSGYSQKNLNDYKYVIVPTKFEFFKNPDQFQLNSLTKFLFEKYGFNAIMANDPFPADIRDNNCIELRAYVVEQNTVFKTKLQVELYDCKNELVYRTEIGQTNVKEYKKAYNLALRDAMDEFADVNYKYNGKKSQGIPTEEVKQTSPVMTEVEMEPKAPIQKEVTVENNAPAEIIVGTQIIKPKNKEEEIAIEPASNIMYAQAIEGGYQVVDSTPKIVMVLYNSGKADTFIVKDQNAFVYKEDGFWYMTEHIDGKTKTKRLNIKF